VEERSEFGCPDFLPTSLFGEPLEAPQAFAATPYGSLATLFDLATEYPLLDVLAEFGDGNCGCRDAAFCKRLWSWWHYSVLINAKKDTN
jgi:hypothetical protein